MGRSHDGAIFHVGLCCCLHGRGDHRVARFRSKPRSRRAFLAICRTERSNILVLLIPCRRKRSASHSEHLSHIRRDRTVLSCYQLSIHTCYTRITSLQGCSWSTYRQRNLGDAVVDQIVNISRNIAFSATTLHTVSVRKCTTPRLPLSSCHMPMRVRM
jgi:hypothetical protein